MPSSKPDFQPASQPKKSLKPFAVVLFALILAIVLGALKLPDFTRDIIANLTYTAPSEITQLANDIGLTDHARFIFGATQPAIENRDAFNEHCESYDVDISTLGCYHRGKIYIYDVQSSELAGIKESTSAHELMHAVWARLSSADKSRLEQAILEVYNDERYHADFAKQLESYSEDNLVEELHSRFATEIKSLPEVLETHYAKYFKDQDALVDFYNHYRAPFEKLDAEFKALASELEDLGADIEELQSEYEQRAADLEQKINEFNQCADTVGCFTSDYAFNSRRGDLVREQSDLDDLYAKLSSLVNDYNDKVDEYNNNILRGEELDSKMNSNLKKKGELNDN